MIVREGENCWRVAGADRVSFLIDGAAYFAALRQAVSQAQHSVFILGWDIDSRARLLPPSVSDGKPAELLPFLNHVLAERPGLSIYLLGWDFSIIYTFEREHLPWYRFATRGEPGLRFHLDSAHPPTASHHQKVVVVDDRVAFAGGIDLAIRRWDTPEHLATHPERVDPEGVPYPPVHDVQIAVDGEAARALGHLARQRWRLATGETIEPPDGDPGTGAAPAPWPVDPWPADLTPDVRSAPVAIARTITEGDAPPISEVAAMNRDAIAAARHWIYIENQYLTSTAIGDALVARLRDPHGPQIVAVLPRKEGGWLEQSSMGVLRGRLLRRLHQADRFGRLRIYFPVVPELPDDQCVNVHSKVLIVDDQLLRIGSSNLSNRSVGLDSECDLIIEAGEDARLRAAVAGLRDRLLGEHLGCSAAHVAETLRAHGSLVTAVEALRGGARSLQPLPIPDEQAVAEDGPVNLAMMDGLVCDPERPPPDQLVAAFVPPAFRRPVHRSLLVYTVIGLAVLGLAALWMFTPLRQYLSPQRIREASDRLRDNPWAPVLVPAGYVAGSLVLFPLTVLLTATALIFDPLVALSYCFAGALAAAAATYGVGRLLRGRQLRWLSGPRVEALRRHLRHRSLLAVVAARLLPLGSFSVINVVAGALGLPLHTFLLGTGLGLLPGILGLTMFADRLGRTLRHPQLDNLVVLGLLVVLFVATMAWVRRRLIRLTQPRSPAPVPRRA